VDSARVSLAGSLPRLPCSFTGHVVDAKEKRKEKDQKRQISLRVYEVVKPHRQCPVILSSSQVANLQRSRFHPVLPHLQPPPSPPPSHQDPRRRGRPSKNLPATNGTIGNLWNPRHKDWYPAVMALMKRFLLDELNSAGFHPDGTTKVFSALETGRSIAPCLRLGVGLPKHGIRTYN
jgi:hypothetical protein